MKEKYVKIINLIVAVLVALFCIGQVFAWFADRKYEDETNFGGSSAGAYFAYGDGSFENPFVINKPNHLYNLAWLQNTGRFDKQYYFELDPDMEGSLTLADDFWLPPIGNEENPFEGVFDGRGKTISNLRITTDKAKLYMNPFGGDDESYEFSQAVGFFGNTSGEDCAVKNFILDNPLVQVSSVNTKYSAEGNKAVGIAVGHVEGLCQSIGVYAHGSTATPSEDTLLDVQVTEYNTFNSILGELGAGVTSSVTGGGHGAGGSGNAFGANFEMEELYDRMDRIYANGGAGYSKDGAALKLPEIEKKDSSSGTITFTLSKLEKLPFTVTADSTYEGSDAQEFIGDNNIGYMLGNQNKIYNKTVEFGDPLLPPDSSNTNYHYADGKTPSSKTIPRWIYWSTNENLDQDVYNESFGFKPLTQAEYDALPQDMLDLIPSQNGEVTGFNSMRLSQTYQNAGVQLYAGTDANGQWSPHGQISWMGKTYGEGYASTQSGENSAKYKNPAVDENGIRYTADGYKIEDGTNYMFDENHHYFVSNSVWPYDYYAVDEEGYIVNMEGSRYKDIDGEEIKYGGYTLDDEGYLVKEDGNRLIGTNGYNSEVKLTPKTGTTIAYYNYTRGVALPNCGIWFKPSQAGKIRLLMYTEKSGDGFAILKLRRTSATPDDPFKVDYSKEGKDITCSDDEVIKRKLPCYTLCYFEFELKQEDIEAGNVEYWIMEYGSGGAYFVYMDLGASESDNSAVVPDVVSAVDFIYEGVEIAQDDEEGSDFSVGDFIVQSKTDKGKHTRYNATRTSVYFENISLALQVAFVRVGDEGSAYTLRVVRSSEQVTATNVNLVEWTDTPSIAVPGLSG